VVVEGIQELDQLATVRWTESVPVTRETGGDILDRLFDGERVLVIATGEVEAGVDLGDIGKDDVSVNSDTVTIDHLNPRSSQPASTRRRPASTTATSAP
jgi:hypothetical protein